jgi:hypothetical protein
MNKKTSKYWGVSYVRSINGMKSKIEYYEERPWYCSVQVSHEFGKQKRVQKRFATEREAAIHADKINLEHNLGKPLNILKPKP